MKTTQNPRNKHNHWVTLTQDLSNTKKLSKDGLLYFTQGLGNTKTTQTLKKNPKGSTQHLG